MNMDQLKNIFKTKGLTVHMHTRRKGLRYVYAAWRDGSRVKQVYFAPYTKVEQMTQEEVLEKLEAVAK